MTNLLYCRGLCFYEHKTELYLNLWAGAGWSRLEGGNTAATRFLNLNVFQCVDNNAMQTGPVSALSDWLMNHVLLDI